MAHDSNCGDSASTPNAKLSAISGKGEGGTQVDQLLTPASVGQASLSLSLSVVCVSIPVLDPP